MGFDARAELQRLLEEKAEQQLAENWEAYYERLDAPRRAWADLLMRQPWHWFATLTFRVDHEGPRGGVHEERAKKSFRFWLSQLNRELFGPNWHKRKHAQGGCVWALGQELHKSGRIHFHALVAAPHVDLNSVARRLTWMDAWYLSSGIARIEPPASQADVAGYVSKYVVKGGQVDLSENFGRANPPSLF